MSLPPNQISQLRRRFTSAIRTCWTHEVLWALLLLIALVSLYVNGLTIRYGSDDDVVISWWFHHKLFHQAEIIIAQGCGRFYVLFFWPISSALLQIKNEALFNPVRLTPYILGLLGFAKFMNEIGGRHFPALLTLAICLAFTPIWTGYTPVLGYPWWFSLGFAAFCWGALIWVKWFQTRRLRWAFLTILLITVSLCTVESFVLMLAVPAIAIAWRLTMVDIQREGEPWIRDAMVAALPGVIALIPYLLVLSCFSSLYLLKIMV
jgi:hypothetical protein